MDTMLFQQSRVIAYALARAAYFDVQMALHTVHTCTVRQNMTNELTIYFGRGGLAQWSALRTTDQGVSGSRPGRVAVRCGLEQVTFTPCNQEAVDVRLTQIDCDEAGDYVVPNVLSPRDL